jgi:hypothetical protein
MAQQQLKPFRSGTRQRLAQAGQGSYAFTIGTTNTLSIPLPNIGMLNMLILQLTGTITYSATGTFALYGPWSLLQAITVFTNLGSTTLWQTTGFGGYLAQRWQREGWQPDAGGLGTTTADAEVYVFPTSGTAAAWTLTWFLPIAVNDGMHFDMGMLNQQSPQIQSNLQLTFANATTVVGTNITALAGNAVLWYWYYDIGDPSQYALPPLILTRTLEDLAQPITTAGADVLITIPQLGVMLNYTEYAVINSVLSDAYSQTYLRVNKTDFPYIWQRSIKHADTRRLDLLNHIVGVADTDYYHAYGPKNLGDFRDTWDTEAFAFLENGMSIPSGTTVAAGDGVRGLRRVLQMLQATPAAPTS